MVRQFWPPATASFIVPAMSLGPLVFGTALGQFAALAVSRRWPRLWLLTTLLGSALVLAIALVVLFSGGGWEWRGPVVAGGAVHLRLDALGAFFAALLAIVSGSAAVYAREYWADAVHPRSAAAGRMWWSVLVGAISIVLTALNGLHFLLAWELFTIAAFFLVTLNRHDAEVRTAGALYLNASHVATLGLFAFFALLAAQTGSWELGPMRDRPGLAPLFWLALFGFGLKAGAFPLHIWLPSAHANAPSHVSAMLSGVTIKLGIFGLMRFSGWLPVPTGAAWSIATIGLASAVLGVAFALGQHDLKRLLAYHSVENIGIILIGLGFALIAPAPDGKMTGWGGLAMAGALLHVWNHGLFKSLLFLGAGSVQHATRTREMSQLGGLWRAMPWTTALFALGAIAIAGLPPLNGFISEWLLYLGLLEGAVVHGAVAWGVIPAIILLAVTGALALACFVKVCGVVFLGAPRSAHVHRAHEAGWQMRGAMIILGLGCVVIALAPVLVWPAIAAAYQAWDMTTPPLALPPSLAPLGTVQLALAAAALFGAAWLWRQVRARVTSAPTWDCGYAQPTARMQYTAGSFAATITEWFEWILRPERHVDAPAAPFPARATFVTHTPETVLEHGVEPLGRLVLRLSLAARRLQHGRLQSYLLYLLVGVVALACLVMLGGPQ